MIALWQRSWFRYPMYVVFGFFVFMVSLLLAFPDDEIRDIIQVQAEKALKHRYEVIIKDVDLYWLTGLELQEVEISKRSTTQATLDADLPDAIPMKFSIPVVAARLSILRSLFNFAPAVQIKMDVGGGTITGGAVHKKDVLNLDLSIGPVDLRKTPMISAVLGVPFFGELEGDLELAYNTRTRLPVGGAFELNGDKVTFGPATVKTDKLPAMAFVEVPQTNMGNLKVEVAVETPNPEAASHLAVKKLSFAGRDLRGDVWGNLNPEPAVRGFSYDLSLRMQFDTEYVTKNSLAPLLSISKVASGKNKDWYGFRIGGAGPKIQIDGDPSVADGPSDGGPSDGSSEGASDEVQGNEGSQDQNEEGASGNQQDANQEPEGKGEPVAEGGVEEGNPEDSEVFIVDE